MDQWEYDFLRPLERILSPDERNLYSFPTEEEALDAHYNMISEVVLNSSVHNDVKVQFETAKNAFLYSFFAYRLAMLAVHQAVAATELGLRRFLGDPQKNWRENTLKPLLQRAHDKEIIDVSQIRSHLDIKTFKDFLGNFRNDLSHGTHTLMPPYHMIGIIKDCASVLNQLFDHVEENQLTPSWDGWI